jgi:DNA-binding SARP family transcriptional activator
MGLLWADRPEDKARRSLNEAIRVLRAHLGEDRLLTQGDAVRLNDRALNVDALEFEAACREGRLQALDLLRGEFLEGFHVEEALAFDAWTEDQRNRIREAATRLLVARAQEQLAVNRHVEASALARRALGISPYHEPALSLGMRSAALEGDQAGALALYHQFAERIQRELGESPSAASAALADRIREGRWHVGRGRHTPVEPPLVGRRELHAQLFTRLERLAQDGPCCLVIAGDAGSGRTRLLQACAERLALAGATVAVTRVLESDHDAPWSTLRALMRAGLAGSQGVAATDHLGLRVLAGIVPELAARVQPVELRDAAQVADAIASLLRAIAEERPVALLIDDAQWADGSTLAALRVVWSREKSAPLALVLTVESGQLLGPEGQALLASVGREVAGLQARLDPLPVDALVALTEAMAPWCSGAEERDRLARRVAHESGGNVFLASTLLRDLAQADPQSRGHSEWPPAGGTFDSSLPITLPGAVRSAILTRVNRLDADSLTVLRTASVAGELLDPAILSLVSGVPPDRVEIAIENLEDQRFVVFDDERYAFNGRLLPAVIERECIQPGGRHRLRQRWIDALAACEEMGLQLLRVRLLATEGRPETFEAAVGVVEQALAAGALRAATTALRIAERVATRDAEKVVALDNLRQRAGLATPSAPA